MISRATVVVLARRHMSGTYIDKGRTRPSRSTVTKVLVVRRGLEELFQVMAGKLRY